MKVGISQINRIAIGALMVLLQCSYLLPNTFLTIWKIGLTTLSLMITLYQYRGTVVNLNFIFWAIFFCLLCVSTLFFSVNKQATLDILKSMLVTYGILVVLSQSIRSYRDLKWTIKCLMWGGVLYCSLVMFLQGVGNMLEQGINVEYSNDTIMQYTYVSIPSTLLCIYYLFMKENNKLYFPLTCYMLFLCVLSERRKSVLLPIAFIVICIFLKDGFNRKILLRKGVRLVIVVFLTGLVINSSIKNITLYRIYGYRLEQLIRSFSGETTISRSLYIRGELKAIGMDYLSKNNVFLGLGLGNFQTINPFNLYAHDNYLELLCTAGIVATVCYYSIYIILIKGLAKNMSGKQELLFLCMLATNLVSDTSTITYYRVFSAIYLVLAACYLGIREREKLAYAHRKSLLRNVAIE